MAAAVWPVAASPSAATPGKSGDFSQTELPSLGDSSFPGKKPQTNGILVPPHPVTPSAKDPAVSKAQGSEGRVASGSLAS